MRFMFAHSHNNNAMLRLLLCFWILNSCFFVCAAILDSHFLFDDKNYNSLLSILPFDTRRFLRVKYWKRSWRNVSFYSLFYLSPVMIKLWGSIELWETKCMHVMPYDSLHTRSDCCNYPLYCFSCNLRLYVSLFNMHYVNHANFDCDNFHSINCLYRNLVRTSIALTTAQFAHCMLRLFCYNWKRICKLIVNFYKWRAVLLHDECTRRLVLVFFCEYRLKKTNGIEH